MAQSPQLKHSHRRLVQRSIVLCLGLLLLPWLAGSARARLTPQAQPQTSNPTPITYLSTAGLTRQDALPIEPGKLIERELPGKAKHFYRVPLTAGQSLHIVAEQFDANVGLGIYGPDSPDDKPLIELNSWSEGLETLCWVANVTGIYQIVVGSQEIQPVRYRIRIEELRPATPRDRLLAAAYLAHYEGAELRSGDKTAELQQMALKKLQEALPLWREVGERRMEAATLLNLAWVYDSLNEYQKVLEVGEQALALREVASDRYWELNVLLSIAEAHHFLGEYQPALQFLEQAWPLCQAHGHQPTIGWVLNDIASAHNALGEKQEALNFYQQSLLAYQAASSTDAALALTNIAGVYASLGEPEQALDALKQALPLWKRRDQPDPREARTHNRFGEIYAARGEFRRAIESYQQALQIWRVAGDRWGESYVLNNLGRLHASLGQYQRARLALNQAWRLRRDISDRRGQAYTLTYLGALHHSLGSPQKALGFYHEALPISQDIGDREGQALTHYHLARALRDLGQMNAARTQIEESLKLVEDIRANVLGQELRASYLASVRDYYEFYVDLLMRMHQREPLAGFAVEALHASEKARARSLFDLLAEARVDLRRDIDPQLAAQERGLQQRLNAKAEYQIHLRATLNERTAEQATAVAKEIDGMIADLHQVKAQITALHPRSQPEPLDAAEIQRLLDSDTLLLEYAIGEERSYLWAVTLTEITSYALPKRAVIERAARRFYDLLTVRNRSVKHETPAQRQARRDQADAQASQAAAALSRLLLAPAAAQLGTKRLLIAAEGALQYVPFAALPAPATGRQSDGEMGRSISSHPVTQSPRRPVPFSPLIADHEIVTLPSASTLAMLRRDADSRQRAPKTIAVLADPVFTADDERVHAKESGGPPTSAPSTQPPTPKPPTDLDRALRDLGVTGPELRIQRLPGTRREAEQIMNLVPASESMQALDFAASRATAIDSALSQYRILHFATHALIDSARPEISGIVLSLVNERGEPQEGFLRTPEIFNLKLRAELAVLSACQTGLGKEVKGEGLVGLTQSFMYAGAPRVLVSLWSLNDKATAELMAKFYQHLLGPEHLSPAAALRAAQIEMSKDAPYFWAAFVLQGEWK